VVGAIEASMDGFDLLEDEQAAFVPKFEVMVKQTPTLRAHWLEILDRLARVAAEQLASQAGVAPSDPEPTVAGRALVGLIQVDSDSRVRHIAAGLRGPELRAAVVADVRQAARLLENGLASLGRGV
jgi:hypothetical protein